MPTVSRSFATSDGKAYYKHTGRYNEFTKKAKGKFQNHASSALTQKNLAPKGNNSAAAMTIKAVKKDLGL